MTETVVAVELSQNPDDEAAAAAIAVPDSREVDELEVARELVRQAREAGVSLTGPGGLLKAMTKTVIETALDEELSEHLGYDRHDPAGYGSATPATEPVLRPCSPMRAGRSRSMCRATGRAASNPRSSRSVNAA
ncbi:transposase [Mycolicibacterium poriferae]|uniref:Transposase n=1 Tax=Mycolicibacterium poriferae TaxID=39694 RepID=A0A6N4VA96_9MYCO|nr:transposase [Mycolicibacterium poriferae]